MIDVSKIKKITYPIMFDRIEAGTYLIAAAITEGNLRIKNVIPNIIKTEIDILKKIGAKISIKKNEINIIGKKKHYHHHKTPGSITILAVPGSL